MVEELVFLNMKTINVTEARECFIKNKHMEAFCKTKPIGTLSKTVKRTKVNLSKNELTVKRKRLAKRSRQEISPALEPLQENSLAPIA